ncbi:MAG: hypothetical protein KAI67_02390 [Candidatus Pacebacteria bacterium]|nr:hypothetical protein [Candidatus Paceibacterota bacterium]
MTKKQTTISAIIIQLIIAIAILVFYVMKTDDKVQEQKNNNTQEQDSELYEIEGDNSFDLIDIALEKNNIDRETSLIYKMYAVFGDEKLPSEYASEVMMQNANEQFIEVREAFDSLSPETQEALSPFFKRPNDLESYYNLKYQESIEQESTDEIISKIIPSAQARANVNANLYCDDCYLFAANSRVKIWYPNVSITAQEAEQGYLMDIDQATLFSMAERLQTILNNDRIYKRFTELLQREPDNDGVLGGDDALDIYIGTLNIRAAAVAVSDKSSLPSSAYIIMNAGWLNFDSYYKKTLAHEMFHVFQYSYTWKLSNSRWWAEATAVWSEDFIYKGFNYEQKRLKYFLPFPEKTLFDNQPSRFKYGAYIFPYYLAQNSGNETIRNIWEDCNYAGCLDAVDNNISDGFKGQWKEFTLWNYNITPVRYYTDENGFSTISSSQNAVDHFVAGGEKISIGSIRPLSAQVLKINNIVDQNIYKQLIFKDLKKFTSQSDKASIKAIIYFQDRSNKIEDWTDKEERRFCLYCDDEDKDKCVEENLNYIVLIFSNSDKSNSTGVIEIETEGKAEACSGTWYGTLKVSETMIIPTPLVTITETWSVMIKEELEQVTVGKDNNINPLAVLNDSTIDLEFHVMKQDIKYSYKEVSDYTNVTGSGETKREHSHQESRGAFINNETELDTIVRMTKNKTFTGAQSVLGQGEYIFNGTEQMYGECDFVTLSTGEIKCPEYFSCGDTGNQFIGGKDIIVEPTENETRIKGSDSYSYSLMGASVTTKMEWDYSRR